MKYEVRVNKKVRKPFRSFPKKDQSRIKKVLLKMETDPYGGDVVKLSGYDAYRKRVGTYRIIFTTSDAEAIVLVFDILRRNENTYKNF